MSGPLLLWVVPGRNHIGVNEGSDEIWLAARSGRLAHSIASAPTRALSSWVHPGCHGHTHLWFVCRSYLTPTSVEISWYSFCMNSSLSTEWCPRHHFEWLLSVRDGHPLSTWLASLTLTSFLQEDSTPAYLGMFLHWGLYCPFLIYQWPLAGTKQTKRRRRRGWEEEGETDKGCYPVLRVL